MDFIQKLKESANGLHDGIGGHADYCADLMQSAAAIIENLIADANRYRYIRDKERLHLVTCCGYMTYHREHMGCIRAASHQAQWQPIESNLPSCKESAIEYLVFDTLNNKVGHDYWMVPDDGGEPFWNHYGEYVSHWMPLPQGPNVVD